MRKAIYILLTFLCLTACDDGDILFTSFDFDETNLRSCGGVGDYVFYNINNENQESLSLQLRTTDSILYRVDTIAYLLGTANHNVHYRTYDGPLDGSYFCNAIPATEPRVTSQLTSTGGQARVITTHATETTASGISHTYTAHIHLLNLRMEDNGESAVFESLYLGKVERTENE